MRPEMIKDFAAKMSARSGRLYVMYGQTEASPRITTLPAEEALSNLGSVGPALPGGRLEIRDEKGGHLPSGAIGEVVYFGPNVMMGYATSRAELAHGYQLKDGLHTGDLGYLDDRGYLTLSGRANRFAKVHGSASSGCRLRFQYRDIRGLFPDVGTELFCLPLRTVQAQYRPPA